MLTYFPFKVEKNWLTFHLNLKIITHFPIIPEKFQPFSTETWNYLHLCVMITIIKDYQFLNPRGCMLVLNLSYSWYKSMAIVRPTRLYCFVDLPTTQGKSPPSRRKASDRVILRWSNASIPRSSSQMWIYEGVHQTVTSIKGLPPT